MAGRPTYEIPEDVTVSHTFGDGRSVVVEFTSGVVTPETDDEWYVLENRGIPEKWATRARAKREEK